MLPTVIRALGLEHAGRRERRNERQEEHKARREAIETALERLDALAKERELPDEILGPVRARQRERLKHIEHRSALDDGHRKFIELHDDVELALITAERGYVNDQFRKGKLNDESRRRIERDLDLRESRLANLRAEE
jgi:CPA1 family monovalent cation:H+ antiporter